MGRSPHNVRSSLVILTEDVEQEEIHVIVERLVVQEQLCQITEVLAVLLLLLAIHLLSNRESQLHITYKRAKQSGYHVLLCCSLDTNVLGSWGHASNMDTFLLVLLR